MTTPIKGMGLNSVQQDSGQRALNKAKRLANQAQTHGGKDLKKVARELEGVFLGMMFQEMAKTTDDEGGIFPKSPGRQMYEEWFRAEVSKNFAASGGVGLGDMITRQMEQRSAPRVPLAPSLHSKSALRPPQTRVPSQVPTAKAAIKPPKNVHGKPPAAARRTILPADGPVTSHFGHRTHPVTGKASFHSGVDIAVPVGSPVRTPYSGTVKRVDTDPLMGVRVVVEHRGGFRSVYGHNSEVLVRPGQQVRAGEQIARSGNTGRSTGPHLHFSLYRGNKAVNPHHWLKLSK